MEEVGRGKNCQCCSDGETMESGDHDGLRGLGEVTRWEKELDDEKEIRPVTWF